MHVPHVLLFTTIILAAHYISTNPDKMISYRENGEACQELV